jgi:hypothetical protein
LPTFDALASHLPINPNRYVYFCREGSRGMKDATNILGDPGSVECLQLIANVVLLNKLARGEFEEGLQG